jgi:hypothetical protein
MIFNSLALLATLLLLRVADAVAAAEPTTAEALALLPQQQQQQQEEQRQLQNSFEVIAYRCNEDYEEVRSGRPLERDQSIRICIETTRPTKLQDVYILKVNTFRFFKEEATRSFDRMPWIPAPKPLEGKPTWRSVRLAAKCVPFKPN